jgi:hypothetical protein
VFIHHVIALLFRRSSGFVPELLPVRPVEIIRIDIHLFRIELRQRQYPKSKPQRGQQARRWHNQPP